MMRPSITRAELIVQGRCDTLTLVERRYASMLSDTIAEFNGDSKAEYDQLNLAQVARN